MLTSWVLSVPLAAHDMSLLRKRGDLEFNLILHGVVVRYWFVNLLSRTINIVLSRESVSF